MASRTTTTGTGAGTDSSMSLSLLDPPIHYNSNNLVVPVVPNATIHYNINNLIVPVVPSATWPPFARVCLSSGCRGGVRLPLILQPYLSSNEWEEIWMRLRPIQQNVTRFTTLYRRVWVTLYIAMITAIVGTGKLFHDTNTINNGNSSGYMIALTCGLMLVHFCCLGPGMNWVAKSHLDDLRSICRDVIDTYNNRISPLAQLRYTIECEQESAISICSPPSYYLTFIPLSGGDGDGDDDAMLDSKWNDGVRNGYLRIHLFCDSGFVWNPLSLTHLETFQTLPPAFQATEQTVELWTRFWAALMNQSNQCLIAYRWYLTCQCFVVVFIPIYLVLMETVSFSVYFTIFIGIEIIYCVLWFRFIQLTLQQLHLITTYSSDFAAEGVHIEHRELVQWNGLWGSLLNAHYMYVFPRRGDTTGTNSGSTGLV